MKLLDVTDDVVVTVVQVEVKHLDGRFGAEDQLPEAIPDLHLKINE
ncbi:MAG: hypothetical protein GY696_27115 [Gammaproteobacteria bacterium]|nr:hypothetical protein [Gammaproteobacteria bacterium]